MNTSIRLRFCFKVQCCISDASSVSLMDVTTTLRRSHTKLLKPCRFVYGSELCESWLIGTHSELVFWVYIILV